MHQCSTSDFEIPNEIIDIIKKKIWYVKTMSVISNIYTRMILLTKDPSKVIE